MAIPQIHLSDSDKTFIMILALFFLNGLLTAFVAWNFGRLIHALRDEVRRVREVCRENGFDI